MRFVVVLAQSPVATIALLVASTSVTSWIPPFGSEIEIARSPSRGVAIGIDHTSLPFFVKRCLNVALGAHALRCSTSRVADRSDDALRLKLESINDQPDPGAGERCVS